MIGVRPWSREVNFFKDGQHFKMFQSVFFQVLLLISSLSRRPHNWHLSPLPISFFLSDLSPIIGNACQWLPNSLTHSVTLSKLYWCDPGVWRCQLKTYWGCCWCWWWGSCWQQFVSDLEAEVWSKSLSVVQTLSTRFGQDFVVENQARFWSWSLVSILLLMFGWGYGV